MQGKLKKIGNEYKLYAQDDSCIATSWYAPYQRLSKNNCQTIENGYDLDELAREACNITDPLRLDSQKYKQDPYFKIGFNKGFQKALEILDDKKFSEDDIKRAILKARIRDKDNPPHPLYSVQSIVQSLQQTEWDVSFNPEEKDSEGCLILKRL